jgi:hypothetical protein
MASLEIPNHPPAAVPVYTESPTRHLSICMDSIRMDTLDTPPTEVQSPVDVDGDVAVDVQLVHSPGGF